MRHVKYLILSLFQKRVMLMNKRQAKKLKKKNFIKHYKIYNEINNEIIKEIERLFPPGMMKRLAFIQNYAMWGPFKTIEESTQFITNNKNYIRDGGKIIYEDQYE